MSSLAVRDNTLTATLYRGWRYGHRHAVHTGDAHDVVRLAVAVGYPLNRNVSVIVNSHSVEYQGVKNV